MPDDEVAETGIPLADLIRRSPALGDAMDALSPAADLLERVFYDDASMIVEDDSISMWVSLIFDGQVGFDLPGGFAIKIGKGEGVTPMIAGLHISSAGVAVAVEQLAVVLSVPDSLLRPAPSTDGGETPEHVELVLDGALIFDEKRNLRVEGFESVSLPRSFVGGSSVVISADDVSIDTEHGLTLGTAHIELPKDLPQLAPEELVLTNAAIGPAGVSGRLEAKYTPQFDAEKKQFTGQGSGELGSVPFAFASMTIELRDNDLVEADLAGQLLLPFFEKPTDVAIALHADGSLAINVGGTTPLATIERKDLLRLSVARIGFEVVQGKLVVHIGGTVTLLIGGAEWPTFRADDITINSKGEIAVHGVGFELKNGKPLDLGSAPAGAGLLPGITIDKLDVSGNPLDTGLVVDAQLSTTINAGPFTATLKEIGLHGRLIAKFSGSGPSITDRDFKHPNTIGISVDASTVKGGGLIGRTSDAQKEEYSGIIDLEIAGRISVKGIALLTTRSAEAGQSYSFVVIIFVEGFTPIQLGFGFALTGIGGLLGVNRTFDEEALRAGLKSHALDSVMFPVDPVRNASQILSNISRLFPPASGHYLFGPMVQIAWGAAALITADVALVLEFGARTRLLILAQVRSILPSPERELVRLQMDAVGVIDFDQSTAALDATLHDSRLLNKFTLTGDMAMRMKWASSPNFALAVGGLHPAFNPPPNFPKLERIAINLSSGDNPRLRCEAYFALTANTVQFGARAELYASAAGFSIHGDIGYDVLIQFDPFSFLAEFHAQLQLKRGSTSLFMVELKGSLAGPRPLHIKGKATFSILWWDVSVSVDKVLVEGERPPLPAPIDVLPRLQEALANPANWTTNLPAPQRPLVGLRADATVAADVLLHPLGTLTIKQGVVPLNIDISRFGQAAPAGARRFSISSINLAGSDQHFDSFPDFFAPAQFFELSDDEKLSRPSFESLDAGITFGSADIALTSQAADWLEVKSIEFETWLIDDDTKLAHRSPAELPPPPDPQQPPPPKIFYQLRHELLLKQAQFGAAGSSDIRRSGKAKYRVTTAGKYQVTKEGWSIVATDDLSTVRQPSTYSQAEQALRDMKENTPERASRFQILRLSEVRK